MAPLWQADSPSPIANPWDLCLSRDVWGEMGEASHIGLAEQEARGGPMYRAVWTSTYSGTRLTHQSHSTPASISLSTAGPRQES